MPNDKIQKLTELANQYPSPHNGQPIELKPMPEPNSFELYFHNNRGLQATDISFLFSFVTMGVFLNHLEACSRALGHELSYSLNLPKLNELSGTGMVKFGNCIVKLDAAEPDQALHDTLLQRQTSRKKYSEGLNEELSNRTVAIAYRAGMRLVKMNRADTHQAIWLNQRAVFDDMFDEPVRHELDHWLRYTQAEKEAKKDGLAYDCMELNGTAMKFITRHHKILRWPGVGSMLKKYYLRTMSDDSDAYYLLTPFSNEQEAFNVGTAIMRIWLPIAAEGYYLHPFGTIMSNEAAHKDFLKLAGIKHEDKSKNFLVFIYRAGKSERPNASLRIPVKEHLLRSEHD